MRLADATSGRDNNFNLLRLFFAVLVIVSHAAALIDGNRSGQEPLLRVFGTYSFGELAVNSFFILSGYLITGSWLAEPRLTAYMRKRALRILPGFLVAVAVCMTVIGPMGSPSFWADLNVHKFLVRLPLLMFEVEAFPGHWYRQLNGALWTIHFEFVCYLLVAVLGLLGVLSRPRVVVALFASCLALHIAQMAADPFIADRLSGAARTLWIRGAPYPRFAAFFLAGAVLYFYRDRLKADGKIMALAAAAFVVLMLHPLTGALAMAVPWAMMVYLVGRRGSWLARKVGRTDLSYGIYLYGWPVQQLVIQRVTTDYLQVILWTLVGSTILAAASWHLIERPALRFKNKRRGYAPSAAAATSS